MSQLWQHCGFCLNSATIVYGFENARTIGIQQEFFKSVET